MKRYIGWFVNAFLLVFMLRYPVQVLAIASLLVVHWVLTRPKISDDEIIAVIGPGDWKSAQTIQLELRLLKPAPWWGSEVGLLTVFVRLFWLVATDDLESRISTWPTLEYRLTGSGSRRRVEAERLQPEIDTDLITIN